MTTFTFTIKMTVDIDVPAEQLDAVLDRLVDEAENLVGRCVGEDAVHVGAHTVRPPSDMPDDAAHQAPWSNSGPPSERNLARPGDDKLLA
jgi:hypothetical protein